MKLVARVIAALALVGLATPALPCGMEKSTKTANDTATGGQPGAAVAKADKADKADKGEKSQKSEKAQKPKGDQAQKTAAN